MFLCFSLVNELYDVVEQRPRSVSDPTHGLPGKLVNTFQEESFRLMATTEKKRRLHAEKQLDKFKSGQSLELTFLSYSSLILTRILKMSVVMIVLLQQAH